ncbi:MAG TPA: O-antigen ligase [Terracidiphilus sp.]|nr:O-antigen ligase [Terracidiphilus sp.]
MRNRSERIFVVVLLLVSMHVVSGVLSSTHVNTETSNAIISTGIHLPSVLSEMVIYLWCAVLVLPRWKTTWKAVKAAWPILLLPVLVILSSLWSVNPLLTLRRSSFFTLSTIMAIYLGERFTLEEFAELFAQAECWFIFATTATYLVYPAKVLDPSHPGAWRGLTIQKNVFGECMAVAVLLLVLMRFRRHRALQRIFLCAAILMLYLSHSVTPTVCCAVVLVSIPVLRRVCRLRIKERVAAYTFCGTSVVLGILLVTNYSASLLPIFGRDSTLSGRAQLWSLVMEAIWKRPILGYGYEAFWEGFQGVSRGILESTGWLVPMAHNGYLEVWLGIGLAGLALVLYLFFRAMRMALQLLRQERRLVAAWPIVYLLFFALHNLGESTLLTRTTFEFLVFVQVSVALQQARNRERAAVTEGTQKQEVSAESLTPA